jgi:hypothetical protein
VTISGDLNGRGLYSIVANIEEKASLPLPQTSPIITGAALSDNGEVFVGASEDRLSRATAGSPFQATADQLK